MPEAMFIMSSVQDYGLRELAETLMHELELQAVPSSLSIGGFPATRPVPVFIVLDPYGYAAAEGEDALPGDAILRRTIFVCREPPPSPGDTDHIALLARAGTVFALDQPSVAALHRVGIRARLLKPGYSQALDRFDPHAARPIDVLFLGVESPRRTRYLSHVADVLGDRTCRLVTASRPPAADDVDAPLARERWPLLAQSKVLVNLHLGEDSRFGWQGALDAIHAGAVVVTEHSSGLSPLVAGEHLFAASPEALPHVIEAVLRDHERLVRVRLDAYERLSGWIPYALWVSVLRAAIVELVGEPVPDTDLAVTRSAAS
jgi:hypothetical protein